MINSWAPAPRSAVWELSGPLGPERWHELNGTFDRVELGAETFRLPEDAADLTDIDAHHATCGHGDIWPSAFLYCPKCGRPLLSAAPIEAASPWSPPSGSPS